MDKNRRTAILRSESIPNPTKYQDKISFKTKSSASSSFFSFKHHKKSLYWQLCFCWAMKDLRYHRAQIAERAAFTRHLALTMKKNRDPANVVCAVLATILAYGCNIGP